MRHLNCQIFPAKIVLIDTEEEFEVYMKKYPEFKYPSWGTGVALALDSCQHGLILLVVLGDTTDIAERETESILTHEAVHAKQELFKAIGEKNPGKETEAYTVQYLSNYLINEWHYRKNKRNKDDRTQ